MEREETQETIPPVQEKITDQIREYVETQLSLIKLKGVLKTSTIFANVFTIVFVLICALILFFFAIITLALYLGEEVFHSYYKGFGCVSLIILGIAILIMLVKSSLIEPPISNFIIRKIFKD
ncbi:MAG: hypothetical protein INR69_09745 [Mucilaginibacter polytrichastri]|nr:hypothetical protein [Mucilaginibacter polytrichastri]